MKLDIISFLMYYHLVMVIKSKEMSLIKTYQIGLKKYLNISLQIIHFLIDGMMM